MVKRSKSRKKQKSGQIVVSPASLSYNGPTRFPVTAQDRAAKDDATVVELILIGAIASSGAGVIATVFDCYSQASSCAEWSTYLGLYSEFRILSMDIELLPWNRYNLPTTTAAAPLYAVEDRQNSTALASLADCQGYVTLSAHPPSTPVRRVVRMMGSGEADFTSSASSPNADDRFFLKLYSAGNTATTTLYDYVNRMMVQFRNRK
jgi:hypothetical protein